QPEDNDLGVFEEIHFVRCGVFHGGIPFLVAAFCGARVELLFRFSCGSLKNTRAHWDTINVRLE
ncbi:MAG: hypothetical protein WC484_04865, partial [Candidatus Omnitrophota bacterium]